MSALVELSRQQVLVFLFVLVRVGGLTFFAPALDARFAPKSARLLLAIAVALLVAPVYWCQPTVPDGRLAATGGARCAARPSWGWSWGWRC